jgi:hypothetical protein
MRHFHPPIHAAIVAVTVVAGLASYQGVDKLVLARGGSQYGAASEPGHEPSSTVPHTSTTVHTSTTLHTSTTEKHEPTSSTVPNTSSTVPNTSTTLHTSTTEHHGSTSSTVPHTSTTEHHEPPPTTPTTTAPPPPPPTTSVPQLSFSCMSGFTKDTGVSRCSWSPFTGPNFGHYRLTRELVGTPRQTVFESSDQTTSYYYDYPLQAGASYSYIIEAYDTAGNLVARGGPIHLTCCGGTSTA